MSEKFFEYLKSVGDYDFRRHTRKRRGYFMMNNMVIQCLCLAKLNGTEYSIMLDCILRTHGEMNYKKKPGTWMNVDIKSQRFTADKLNIDIGVYNKGIKSLIRKNILKTIEGQQFTLKVNLEFTEWDSKFVKSFISEWMESDKARLAQIQVNIQRKKDREAEKKGRKNVPVDGPGLCSAVIKSKDVMDTEHVIKSKDVVNQSDEELKAELEEMGQ